MSATSEAPAAFRNDAGDTGPISLIREGISDIRSRQRLVRYLVQADIHKRGSDTLLGNLWWILDPLLQMLVYFVFVTIITTRTQEDYPLFIFSAILPWKWFTTVIGDATSSVTSQERLIKQIAFPKIVLPVASATAGVVGFAFGLIPLAALMVLFYQDRITIFLICIPAIAFVQYVFSLAMSILVAAGNVFFRDLGNLMRHLLRLWFYLSPALYSITVLDELHFFQDHPTIRAIVNLNPFAILFEAYRSVIYGHVRPDAPPGPPDWTALAILLGASVVFLGLSTILFKKVEPTFAKVL